MKRFLFRPDNFFATLFIFITVALLGLIVIDIKPLDLFDNALKDFDYTDILYSRIRSRQNLMDTNIVLVSIDTLKRGGIAQELEIIDQFRPRAVGLDVIFEQRKDPVTDSLLKEALNKTPGLVMAMYAEQDEEGGLKKIHASHSYFGKHDAGHVNLTGANPQTSTIRTFKPLLDPEGKKIPSFSAVILSICNPRAGSRLLSYGDKPVVINYTGNYSSFICFSPGDVLKKGANLDRIKDKIVLVGNFYPDFQNLSFEDKFFTPMNSEISGRSWPDMNGMVIHANIISMALKGNFIHTIPRWIEILIAFFICYLNMAFFLYFFVEKSRWFHPFVDLVQLVTLVVIIYVIFLLYEHLNIRFDSALLIITMIFSVYLLDFYLGLVTILNKWFGIKSYLLSKHE
jgi:CHASE2 domain-containing sensor protein